ncbi:hypothetical protein JCM33374_g5664 [Metschnikowia sp. JCM 33374]|nr:hypothetical protein JCM33374_g5664 [Metschnikowia sp. JCM 33374]
MSSITTIGSIASTTANVTAAPATTLSPYFSSTFTTITYQGENVTILLCSNLPATASFPTYGCWSRPFKNSASKNSGISAGMWAIALLVGGTAVTAVAGLT